MAGLLDFIATPEGQGLLSAAFGGLAGARRGAPLNSIGIAGLSGLQGYAGAQDRAVANQYRDLQAQQMQAALAERQQANDFMVRFANPQQGGTEAALAQGAQAGSVGPTVENAQRMPATQPIQNPLMSPDVLHQMMASGNSILVKRAKDIAQGMKDLAPTPVASGSFTINPLTGERQYLPKVGEGMTLDNTGNAVSLPGYSTANAATKGAETAAIESARYPFTVGAKRQEQLGAAGLDVMPVFDASGNPAFATRGQIAAGAGGVRPDMTPGEKVTAAGATSFATNLAKSASDVVDTSRAGAQSAAGTLQNVQLVRGGMNNILTGPLANQRLTLLQVGQMMGINGQDDTERLQNTRAAIQGLARQELSAAGQMKGQGQITESERGILKRAEAGDISDFSKPELETLLGVLERTANHRISSHDALMGRVNAGATPMQVMDFRYQPPQQPGQSSSQQPNQAPRRLNTLPQNPQAGARVRDTSTGKILRFNGRIWQAE